MHACILVQRLPNHVHYWNVCQLWIDTAQGGPLLRTSISCTNMACSCIHSCFSAGVRPSRASGRTTRGACLDTTATVAASQACFSSSAPALLSTHHSS